ncbi:MAG TPA: LysR substrate-binding domain-containing protein [Usitatibacter sp.]|nr:LysR substrate-binding domain-containing protein [Usitatibacter sp.]
MADRRLRVFHAVAKHLSFTKAAESLFMTQPAVTFQVKQLEEHFNTRLFDRTQGRISLTPAGALALEYAERILALDAELDSRLKEFSGQEAGPLLIGASTTIAEFLLPRVLGEFKSAHPGVVPRLVVANSDAVQDRVAERSLDLGFIEGHSHLPSLATDPCGEDELQVVCAPMHALAARRNVVVSELPEHAYIGREVGSGTREVIDKYLNDSGLSHDSLQTVMEASSPEALKGLVATGLGFAIMSRATVAMELRLAVLVAIPLSPPLLRQLSVVYPRDRIHSRAMGSFLQFAKERLGAANGAREAPAAPRRARANARPT